MKYFRNTELAKLYNVSEKSVRNWIEAAQSGKLELQLHKNNGKNYVASTARNEFLIKKIVEKNKKYKNTRGFRTIHPTEMFYEIYNQDQILDIIANLTTYKEIPTFYSYSDGGANYWDSYANRLMDEPVTNILNATIKLLDLNAEYIDSYIKNVAGKDSKVNVIDLGPGNGLPIHPTLQRLLKQKRLNRYIAIESSKEMIHILENNIQKWFKGKVTPESYVRDFSHERFGDLLAEDYAVDGANGPVNLVFLLGGTLSNFRDPKHALQTISSSLGPNDILICSGYLDTPETRRYFDFSVSHSSQKRRSQLILDFLGVDESLYDIERKFNPHSLARSTCFIPKVDLNIQFSLSNTIRSIKLKKGEPILLWRHWHKDALGTIKQFVGSGFDIMLSTKSVDEQHFLVMTKIKAGLID
jgi:hypothetical protein